jgi:hypothetical protein
MHSTAKNWRKISSEITRKKTQTAQVMPPLYAFTIQHLEGETEGMLCVLYIFYTETENINLQKKYFFFFFKNT